MKQYLWVGIAVLFVSAYASENPFDLKENFSKLDQDQEVLLGELKGLAERKALSKDVAIEDSIEIEIQDEVLIPISINEVAESLSKVMDDDTEVEKPDVIIVNIAKPKVLKPKVLEVKANKVFMDTLVSAKAEEVVEEVKDNKVFMQSITQEEAKLPDTKKDLESIQEAERKKDEVKKQEAKKEAERREVELYEKERAERLVQQQKEAAEKKEIEDAKSEAKKLLEEQASKKEQPMLVEEVATMTSVDDINRTRENLEETLEADKVYEAAVKEMGEEG